MEQLISIHAPTRGATAVCDRFSMGLKFQSTLPREERLLWLHLFLRIRYFNPRSHERSDFPDPEAWDSAAFQSTLPREERQYQQCHMDHLCRFQSTLPREERRQTKPVFSIAIYFNPRSHERSDMDAILKSPREDLFQSTLPREERLHLHTTTPL